ncbi:hypothetical protein CPB84DRAFT_1816779 [Gymnopilus junonius]|uniref:Uncharacterized protein n=1 Tax=Gymnopilus junonius TaxID=109634 RepID=A0A9P5TKH7_GYMJU|nr:hypothetical protein CPB84DRAFT_1816779 [Gymnopilus junonius]
MQAPNNNNVRGYSDFFTSGFRAVTSRPSWTVPMVSTPGSQGPANDEIDDQRRCWLRVRLPLYHTKIAVRGAEDDGHPSFRSHRDCSTASFPTSWDETSRSSRRSSRSSRIFRPSEESSKGEVWISAGGPSAPNGSSLPRPIDPFSSSPDASSMFIDLSSTENSPSPSGTPRRESFLPSQALQERPTSIQTMPLPSRSRRSSLQYPLARNSKPSMASEPILEDHDEWDAPSKIDWRQFHIDILTDVTQ